MHYAMNDALDLEALAGLELAEGLLEVVPSLAEQLLAEGWSPGAPSHVTAEALSIDRQTSRVLACEHCGKASLDFNPYHRGRRCRVIGTCPACSSDVEL
jgi:hypothetical protein